MKSRKKEKDQNCHLPKVRPRTVVRNNNPNLVTMADANINAPEVPVAADSPPTHSDEQILPRNKWVPVGKNNCFLDVERTQANPIFKIAVDILKNTNFFKAFTASSTIPSIYIQQFWDTIRFDKDKGYNCQLDEQRFYLTKATLRDALQLPQDNNNFTPPPNANTIISFVNELGYPNVVRTLSGVVTNDMYQPWRALATIINLCLTGKTSAFERPRAPVLQILWGVVNKANIDYAERIWEEFTQCIHSFIEDKMNLALHTEGKKKVNPLVIPGVRFTKLIINHLQSIHKFHKRPGSPLHLPYEESALGYLKFSFKNTKRVRFGMAIPDTLISENIRSATYYPEYVAKVAKYQRYLAGEVVSDDEAPAPKPAKGAKPKTPRKPKPQSTSSQPPKPKPAPAKPQEKKRKFAMDATEAPSQAKSSKADEPIFEDEEADIIQKVMEESLKDAYPAPRGPLPPVVIREPEPGKYEPLPEVQGKGKEKVGEEQAAQRRTPAPTIPSSHEESSSLYVELGLTDSETESDNEASREGQAGSDPGKLVEGQAGSDPGVAADSRIQPSHVVHAGPNLEHMNLEVSDTSPQSNPEQMDEEFTITIYPSDLSFTNQFLAKKSQPDEPEKTNTKAEVQSMFFQLHTSGYLHIGELEQHMADLVDANQALEERLDKQGNMMYQLENLDIPRDSALTQLEENYNKGHEDHKMAYEALQTSIFRDEHEQFDADKAEKLKKIKGKQDSPKTQPGSPPPPPPPLPPSGASRASGITGASDSAQNPLPPPSHLTTHHDDQS
ncbi:hypothetical protein Tco_0144435 [Tanacetum coccineum]